MNYQCYFKNWKEWDVFEDRVDGINGVYAFRLKKKFNRLKDETHIIYIGKSDQNPDRNKRPGIWHRLRNYRQKNKGGSQRLKDIEKFVGGKNGIQYAYKICDNPRAVEKELLESYYKSHMELPPMNRSK